MFIRIRAVFLIILLGLSIFIVFKGISFFGGNFKSLDKVIVIDAGHGGKDPEFLLASMAMNGR